jgi:hypothetical protein
VKSLERSEPGKKPGGDGHARDHRGRDVVNVDAQKKSVR